MTKHKNTAAHAIDQVLSLIIINALFRYIRIFAHLTSLPYIHAFSLILMQVGLWNLCMGDVHFGYVHTSLVYSSIIPTEIE